MSFLTFDAPEMPLQAKNSHPLSVNAMIPGSWKKVESDERGEKRRRRVI